MADKNIVMQERNAANTGWDNIYPATKVDNVKDAAGNSHMADYIRQPGYGVTAGSANTYTLTLSPALIAYAAGICVAVKIHVANTGASTLNVNGLGAKSILDSKGNVMTSGKLRLNGIYTLRYDGANFTLQGEGGSGNAIASDLLAGKTASTDAGDITGTMPVNGPATAETVNLTTEGAEYTIAAGNHSGLRKIKAVISGLIAGVIKAGTTVGGILGTFTADATAADSDVLSGKIYYRNGAKGTGNIPSKAAATITPSTANQTIAAGQYLSGVQTISSLGGNAAAADVLAGKTFSSNSAGRAIAGTMPDKRTYGQAATWTNTEGDTAVEIKIPSAGYYDTVAWLQISDANLISSKIKANERIFNVLGSLNPIQEASGTLIVGASINTWKDIHNNTYSWGTITIIS